MINSGLSMLRALSILEEQQPNKKFAEVIGEVRAEVESGRRAVRRRWPSTPTSSSRSWST